MSATYLQVAVLLVAILHSSSFGIRSSNVVRTTPRGDVSMKIFDWARRQAFETFTVPDGALFNFGFDCNYWIYRLFYPIRLVVSSQQQPLKFLLFTNIFLIFHFYRLRSFSHYNPIYSRLSQKISSRRSWY